MSVLTTALQDVLGVEAKSLITWVSASYFIRVRVRVETVVTLRICTRVNPMKPDCSNGKYEKE